MDDGVGCACPSVFYIVSPYLRKATLERHISLWTGHDDVLSGLFIVPMSLTGAVQSKMYHMPAPLRNQCQYHACSHMPLELGTLHITK